MMKNIIKLIAEVHEINLTSKNIKNIINHVNLAPIHILLGVRVLTFSMFLMISILIFLRVEFKFFLQFVIKYKIPLFLLLYKFFFSIIILEYYEAEI